MNDQNVVKVELVKPFYKRWWFWLGVIILIVVLLGLLGGSEKSGEQGMSPSAQQEKKVYQVGENVMVGDVRWKVTKARDRGIVLRASESRFSIIAKDKKTTGKFVEVTVEIENRGSDLRTFTSHKLIDDQGREYVPSHDVSGWIPEDKDVILLTSLNPNIPKQFVAIYEVAVDAKGFKLKAGDLKVFGAKEALILLGL